MDGFPGQLWRREGTLAELLSRSGRDPGPWFPELIRAAEVLPRKTLLDGPRNAWALIGLASGNQPLSERAFGLLEHPEELSGTRAHLARQH